MKGTSVELIFELMGIPAPVVWDVLCESHPLLLQPSLDCEVVDTTCQIRDARKIIEKRGKPHFGVKCGKLEVDYGHVRNCDHSLLRVENVVSGFEDAWNWVSPFTHFAGFRQARILDDEYEHWQNADYPLQYTAVGRSYEGLPMKSNNLPYPLEEMIIDTSKNPGRRVIRQGYVEAVGAVIWLGKQFWALTGTSKQEVLLQKWLTCEELPNDVLRVQAADAPFTMAESDQGRLQVRLRSLLFPQSK